MQESQNRLAQSGNPSTGQLSSRSQLSSSAVSGLMPAAAQSSHDGNMAGNLGFNEPAGGDMDPSVAEARVSQAGATGDCTSAAPSIGQGTHFAFAAYM